MVTPDAGPWSPSRSSTDGRRLLHAAQRTVAPPRNPARWGLSSHARTAPGRSCCSGPRRADALSGAGVDPGVVRGAQRPVRRWPHRRRERARSGARRVGRLPIAETRAGGSARRPGCRRVRCVGASRCLAAERRLHRECDPTSCRHQIGAKLGGELVDVLDMHVGDDEHVSRVRRPPMARHEGRHGVVLPNDSSPLRSRRLTTASDPAEDALPATGRVTDLHALSLLDSRNDLRPLRAALSLIAVSR